MLNFESFGKFIIFIGLFFLAIGVILLFFKQIPYLGKLPGDILIQKKNFTFYFPMASSIILSLAASLLLYYFTRK